MDFSGNPFGAPMGAASAPMGAASASNPFEATSDATVPSSQPSNPWGVPPPRTQYDNESYSIQSSHGNPFGASLMNHGSSHSTYSAPPPYSAAPPMQNPLPAIAYAEYTPTPQQQQSNNPFAASAPPQDHSALVLASNPANPYAMPPSYGQPIVPVSYSSQPWALPQQNQQFIPSAYDPFTKPPPPPPSAPDPVMHEIDHFFQTPREPPPQQQQETEPVPKEEPHASAANGFPKEPPPSQETTVKCSIQEPPDVVAPPQGTLYPPQIQYGQRPDVPPDRETPQDVRNPYSPLLAREAPPGASPLPKAELVRKRGFALARISFRTIVMKKWKQTYWVQYGPHTMLWFRSQADFDDWLNNPYHMQTERNFLIKLAVNFVHDLYKPNVRGYQVTQCRTKGYGNKIVRQFKLERWMDYGPTIAAAFGSYDPAEVDALREAIVECMRNTPLEGGIRATGAVRQPNPSMPPRREMDEEDDDDDDDDEGTLRNNFVLHR
jgi:ribosomal protein S14